MFARQLQSIQKTIAGQDSKEKNMIGIVGTEPIKQPTKLDLKQDAKVTAFAGSGIINDLVKSTDDYIISFDKEESKHATNNIDSMKNNMGSSKDSSSINHFSKRTTSGFRASAAAMFSNQTGGK